MTSSQLLDWKRKVSAETKMARNYFIIPKVEPDNVAPDALPFLLTDEEMSLVKSRSLFVHIIFPILQSRYT